MSKLSEQFGISLPFEEVFAIGGAVRKKSSNMNGAVSLGEVGRMVEQLIFRTGTEMRQLAAEFQKEFPPKLGKKGGYMLTLSICGRRQCKLCPHGLVWRIYDYIALAPVFDRPEAYAGGPVKDSLITRASFQEKVPILMLDGKVSQEKRNTRAPRKKSVFLWRKKKLPRLPPAFYRMKQSEYTDGIRLYSGKANLLNKRRKLLGEWYSRIMAMERSIRTNSLFRENHGG